jgi:hypothetical protein
MRYVLWVAAAVALAAGCDDMNAVDGARGPCGFGGDLSGCPASAKTAEGACWRLVECASIPLDAPDPGDFDWGRCVNAIEGMTADRQTFAIACVASSTCDALKVDGSPDHPYQTPFCLDFGDR